MRAAFARQERVSEEEADGAAAGGGTRSDRLLTSEGGHEVPVAAAGSTLPAMPRESVAPSVDLRVARVAHRHA